MMRMMLMMRMMPMMLQMMLMMSMMLMMKPLFRLGYPDDAHDDAYDAYDGDLGKVSSFCNSGCCDMHRWQLGRSDL